MELYLKKYFWAVNALVIVICATLAAKGFNHLVEAKYLLGSATPAAPRQARTPKRPAEKPRATASKDATTVATRNIFCSTCVADGSSPALASTLEPSDPSRPPATSLPLALLATSVARGGRFAAATVANTSSSRSGSYWLNETIPDAGQIVRIEPRFVDFFNLSANRVERLDLLGAAAPVATAAAAPPSGATPARSGTGGETELTAAIDQGVKKIDDTHWEVERGLVDRLLTDPNIISRSARVVPSIQNNKANGFKLYAIRPNTIYAKIGLQNGDTIHSINGFEMSSADKALEVYTKVKLATSLSVQVTRRGKPLTLEYSIK
ncbi:MAG: type II secretion system protein GspC [Pseudomonadota bacterium]